MNKKYRILFFTISTVLFVVTSIALDNVFVVEKEKNPIKSPMPAVPYEITYGLIKVYKYDETSNYPISIKTKDSLVKIINDEVTLDLMSEIILRAELLTTGCKNRCATEYCTYECRTKYPIKPDYALEIFDKYHKELYYSYDVWLYDFYRAYITFPFDDDDEHTLLLTPEDTITLRSIIV